MCKMKSTLYIVAILSFALASCVQRLPDTDMPNVENGVITMVKAVVKPVTLDGVTGVGNYSWSETATLGLYSEEGVNENYAIVKSTTGSNEAHFYGNTVGGQLTISMPFATDGGAKALGGRVQMRAEQNYYAEALDHFMNNASFLATTSTSEVVFDYYSGLLKVLVCFDVANIDAVAVRAVTISAEMDWLYNNYLAGYLPINDAESGVVAESGEAVVRVSNFPDGVSATTSEPATVWVALAPGYYENLVVDIWGKDGERYQAPVAGPFLINSCSLADNDCVAEKVDNSNGMNGFIGEPGDFNEGK